MFLVWAPPVGGGWWPNVSAVEWGEMYGWLAEAAEAGTAIRSDASWLPDHQPRPVST